ncbi:MAG: PhoX family protein [Betaproteobacteria bacterium]
MSDLDPNPSIEFDTILQRAMAAPSRRQVLKGGLGLSALSFLGLAGCGSAEVTRGSGTPLAAALNFSATPLNQSFDGVSVSNGYKVELLFKLGDPINRATPVYLNNGTETSTSFDFRAGDHHDGMYFFGMNSNGKWDKTVSDRGLLCINHEAITPLFLHANGPSPSDASGRPSGNRTVADEVQKEFRLHGVSVVEVVKSNGSFQINLDSAFNRRITTLTDMEISGPLRGHELLKTKYSPTGVKTRGTVNNCASGYTPWGTYLTCEENWNGYFRRQNTTNRSANDRASELRFGITSTSGRERWASAGSDDVYARWDITHSGAASADADYRYAANTYGFNVEIDPFSPSSTPKKRTAMGRFAHEGAWVAPVAAGKPVVLYMGCDARGEYIYKSVSTALWDPAEINGGLAKGDKNLDSGKLYAAKFNSDFTGEWLELSGLTGTQAVGAETFTFGDASDPYLNTRLSADKKGATKMDRPEWGAVNPANGEVYMTLTNNSQRTVSTTDAANPRSYKDNAADASTGNANGHIIRWREAGSDPAATSFVWDIYVFGAETDDLSNPNVNLSGLTADNLLSSPDGLWFSEKTGILYIQTDDGAFVNETDGKGSTCMLLAAIPGTVGDGSTASVTNTLGADTKTVSTKVGKVGQLKRLLTGPVDCEITGITESYDGKALFINIQHPGEDTPLAALAAPRSSWPYADTGTGNPANAATAKSARPRSATIVLTRTDGGVIGI